MNKSEVIERVKFSADRRRSRLPRRVYETLMRLDEIEPGLEGRAIEATRQHLNHIRDGGLLVLAGPVGVGKTVAAVFLACMLVGETPYTVGNVQKSKMTAPDFWFVPAQLIIDNAYKKDSVPDGMKSCMLKQRSEIMITDDLGREYLKRDGWTFSVVDEFFDSRYREKAPTIATTNLTEYEFKDRYGERVWDRFKEWGAWIWIEGKSLR